MSIIENNVVFKELKIIIEFDILEQSSNIYIILHFYFEMTVFLCLYGGTVNFKKVPSLRLIRPVLLSLKIYRCKSHNNQEVLIFHQFCIVPCSLF